MALSREKEREYEQSLVRTVVQSAINLGFMISVYDGEEFAIENSTKLKDVMSNLFATDQEALHLKRSVGADQFQVSAISLVYGNSPWEVVSDYTANPHTEEVLAEYNRRAKELEDKHG